MKLNKEMILGEFNADVVNAVCSNAAQIKNSGAIDRAQRFLLERNAHKIPYLSFPMIFDLDEFQKISTAGKHLMSVQGKILKHMYDKFPKSEICDIFSVPSQIRPYIDWDNLLTAKNSITRFDIVPSVEGNYFCEINCDATSAGYEIYECLKEYVDQLNIPILSELNAPHEDILSLIRRVTDEKGLDTVLICDWSTYRFRGELDYSILRETLANGLPDLDVRIVYEDNFPEELLRSEMGKKSLIFRGFMFSDMEDDIGFFEKLYQSGATFINLFETEIRSNKCWFAMFFDPIYRKLLSQEEIEAIERNVPHTVILSENNINSIIENKGNYVFKLNSSSSGKGVFIGDECSVEKIMKLLAKHEYENWTAQRRIIPEKIGLPDDQDFNIAAHSIVLGLFLTEGKTSGMVVRASKKSDVVNVSLGHASTLWAIPMSSAEKRKHIDNLQRI